eukprot:TRINITY_DN7124_c0_g2_i1.p1 TRINITY_DN7124_c0_g2~~TRINITY_DN7124_c0_g2_i1.p1  ORF type:complete len:447 (+),score=72.06 TRINITY_DN7124_c0_g2_i1:109-1341(+)
MRMLTFKQLRAAWSKCGPSNGARRRGLARGASALGDGTTGDPLLDRAPAGPPQRAAQLPPASPHRGSGSAFDRALAALRRLLAKLPKPFSFSAPQTNSSTECQLHYQEHSPSLVPKCCTLSPQQSSSSQPEVKQAVLLSNAVTIALQREVADLQARLHEAVRDGARQRAALAGLQLWYDQDQGRGDVELEMDNEWEALVSSFRSGDAHHGETTEAPTVIQGVSTECAVSGGSAGQLTFPEPATPRDPDFARKCLFIDQICYWVGTFVRRDWARTCSTTARAVFHVVLEVHNTWYSAAHPLGIFQSAGAKDPGDHHDHGPEPGPLLGARQAVLDLRNQVIDTDTPDWRWANRFALHMHLTATLYLEMRLRHRQLYAEGRYIVQDLGCVLTTLHKTLQMYDARAAAESPGAS